MTGVVFFQTALGVKRLELLHELLPAAKVVAYLVNPRNVEGEQETKDVQTGARVLGIELHVLRATSEGEIDAGKHSALRHGDLAMMTHGAGARLTAHSGKPLVGLLFYPER